MGYVINNGLHFMQFNPYMLWKICNKRFRNNILSTESKFFYYALLCSHFNADWLKAHSLLIILGSAIIHIKFCKQNTAMLIVRREN